MKKIVFGLCTFLLLIGSTFAQTESSRWGIGINAGVAQYNGEVENQFFSFSGQDYNGLAGLSIHRFLSNHFDLELDLTMGDIKAKKEDGLNDFEYNMGTANLHLTYNFFKYEDVKFRPFIFAGAGMLIFQSFDRDENYLALPAAGLGVNYKLNERINIKYQNTYFLASEDDIDNQTGGGNDAFLHTTIGVSTAIVSTKDADGDGVIDKKDKCPGTTPGVKVNNEGCAVDRDADGVLNKDDKCPDLAGVVDLDGCPDTDGDGIADAEDTCPELAGSAELGGCPDTDKDGIADNVDKCPEIAGLAELEGCPDEEDNYAMGIYEYNKLPLKNGTLVIYDENNVAIDTILTDENGVFRYKVLDPDQYYSIKPIGLDGDVDNVEIYLVDEDMNRTEDTRKLDNGVFVFTKADKKDPVDDTKPSLDIPKDLLTNLNFNSSSSTINIKYYDQLNRLAMIMNKKTGININVNGYADSSGPIDFNNRLSQARADRVKQYLVRKGVDAKRISAKGHGIVRPIGSNETAEGKALNRRVEIKL